jgi:hypothetical protein
MCLLLLQPLENDYFEAGNSQKKRSMNQTPGLAIVIPNYSNPLLKVKSIQRTV